MKTKLLTLTALISCFSNAPAITAPEPPTTWKFSMVQRQIESGGVFQVPVAEKGTAPSNAPIPKGGSEFTIWAYKQQGSAIVEYLVDNDLVGAYMPNGKLKIISPDPYTGGIPRTRIDQGFTVAYEVTGLSQDPEAPEAAKKVLLDHKMAMTSLDGVSEEEKNFAQSFIEVNGQNYISFPITNLPITNVYQDSGLEVFRLYVLPDGQNAEIKLAETKIQIWPLSKASIEGIDENTSYVSVPDVKIQLVNLYPDSETWAQIYPAGSSQSKGERLGNFVIIKDVVPKNKTLTISTINEKTPANGNYTLEVLTKTPFGIESMATVEFTVDRDLELRANFNSLE